MTSPGVDEWVDGEGHEGEKREVTEPDDVSHCQDDVQPEGSWSYLDDVNLPHFVEEVDQNEQTVEKVEAPSPALVAYVEAQVQRVHLLGNLWWYKEANSPSTQKLGIGS